MRRLILFLVFFLPSPAIAGWLGPDFGEGPTPITEDERAMFKAARKCSGTWPETSAVYEYWNKNAQKNDFLHSLAYFVVDKNGKVFRIWDAQAARAQQDLCQ